MANRILTSPIILSRVLRQDCALYPLIFALYTSLLLVSMFEMFESVVFYLLMIWFCNMRTWRSFWIWWNPDLILWEFPLVMRRSENPPADALSKGWGRYPFIQVRQIRLNANKGMTIIFILPHDHHQIILGRVQCRAWQIFEYLQIFEYFFANMWYSNTNT